MKQNSLELLQNKLSKPRRRLQAVARELKEREVVRIKEAKVEEAKAKVEEEEDEEAKAPAVV